MFQIVKLKFADILSKYIDDLSKDDILQNIEMPPENVEGDLGFPCFKLAKIFKKSPNQIAKDFEEKIEFSDTYIEQIKAVGPYLNVFVDIKKFAKDLFEKINTKGENFGKGENKNKTILIEGWQPNTHKAFHIGHIRNAIVSESMSRIVEFAGYNAIRCSYMGDVGAHVAKWIWYYTKFYEGDIPQKNISKWSGELYTKATLKVDENPDLYKRQIHDMQKKLEDGKKELVKIWKETRKLCLNDLNNVFDELDCKIEREYFESEVEQLGIQKVKELKNEGLVEVGEKGALIKNLEEWGLGVSVLLKSNGTSLYATKDIALAYLKEKEFDFDISLYIVATEQIHHFNQLFKTLELIGFDASKLKHMAYGVVKLVNGKMSSRKGNVILYEDFRDQLMEETIKLLEEKKLEDIDIQQTARKISFGAMKFGMLLQDAFKDIIFDMKTALSFDGETGPYLQYTYARCKKIFENINMKKQNIDFENINYELLNSNEEKKLILLLSQFSIIIEKACDDYKPNYVARFALNLAKSFNNFYQNHKVIQDDEELQNLRLGICANFLQVYGVVLDILGIGKLDKM